MSEKIGFAIVGCGNIGPFHAEAIKNIPEAELTVSCDVSREKAGELAAKFGGDACTDYAEMLGRDDVDVVNICLPSGMHEEFAVRAAEAGKHVVMEKPLDVTTEKCDRIIKACEENKVKLAVIFPTRFDDACLEVRKAIDEGKFGRLVMGDAQIKWFRSQEYYDSGGWRGTWKMDGGGALMNQSIHYIDQLQWFMGPVESVNAYTGTLARNIEVEDTAAAILKFKSGAIGTIQGATSIYPGLDSRIGIHGDKGSVIIEGGKIRFREFEGEESKSAMPEDDKSSSGAKDPTKFISSEGHRRQLLDMVKAVKENRSPIVDGCEGRKSVGIICAIYRSAKEGREIKL